MAFILEDLSRYPHNGRPKKLDDFGNLPRDRIGIYPPFEAFTMIDFTGPPGAPTGVWYSMMFQLRKWEYQVFKINENIEVSPSYAQYYQLTHAQKEQLEARIKQGLSSATQAVADMELLKHDVRKYAEFIDYMGYEKKDDYYDFSADESAREKRMDHHSMRAVFIDQVDAHNAEGIAMRNIVSRWPTLITDFMRLDLSDEDPDKIMKKCDVSKAEAVVLSTKNRLYREWLGLFGPEIKQRYIRLSELVKGREASVNEYREWLKPVIARHKLLEEGLGNPAGRKFHRTFFVPNIGQQVSSAETTIWAYKAFVSPELQKGGTESLAIDIGSKRFTPYDDWTKENIIFHPKHGLVTSYPWITDNWVKDQLKDFVNTNLIRPNLPYYSFFELVFDRTNMRAVTGSEFEDGIFIVNAMLLTQNALFAKLLEMKAKEQEFENYVNSLLGVKSDGPEGGKPFIKQKPDRFKKVENVLGKFSLGGMKLFKGSGPYERDFDDRITKYYLKPMAETRYIPLVSFIKNKIGFGRE